jgi:DNA ligase-1
MLANVYSGQIPLNDYWVSEKLDGVRAFWDGKRLISRQGYVFSAPQWFTADFPDDPLDGELWIARGTFEQLSSTVRQLTPDDGSWRRVTYQVFDMPVLDYTFDQRLQKLQALVAKESSPYIHVIDQFKVANEDALLVELQRVVTLGGEGLMLHRGNSLYHAGRSDDVLKLKTYEDAEAVVIAHLPGKGKYQGMMGSLLVETPTGLRFKLGSGFRDAERANPPPIGSVITYKHFGVTRKNTPRFASFLRIRSDMASDVDLKTAQ